jgi:hypothetical protein
MKSPKIWKTGDSLMVSFKGRRVLGQVKLASENGRSLMLEFDAMLGGYVGMMPVLEEDGVFRDLITKSVVTLEAPA